MLPPPSAVEYEPDDRFGARAHGADGRRRDEKGNSGVAIAQGGRVTFAHQTEATYGSLSILN